MAHRLTAYLRLASVTQMPWTFCTCYTRFQLEINNFCNLISSLFVGAGQKSIKSLLFINYCCHELIFYGIIKGGKGK